MIGEVRGEIESDKADLGSAIACFEANDVLVLLGAGAKLEVVGIGCVDVIVLLVAAEALRGARGRADGAAAAALDDIAVALGEVFAVEGDDLVLLIWGLEAGGFDAEMEAAEVHVHIG